VNTADVFITTTSEAYGLTIPTEVPGHPTIQSLVGAIELSAEDNLLATATYLIKEPSAMHMYNWLIAE
jgi:hypothetical protein